MKCVGKIMKTLKPHRNKQNSKWALGLNKWQKKLANDEELKLKKKYQL